MSGLLSLLCSSLRPLFESTFYKPKKSLERLRRLVCTMFTQSLISLQRKNSSAAARDSEVGERCI